MVFWRNCQKDVSLHFPMSVSIKGSQHQTLSENPFLSWGSHNYKKVLPTSESLREKSTDPTKQSDSMESSFDSSSGELDPEVSAFIIIGARSPEIRATGSNLRWELTTSSCESVSGIDVTSWVSQLTTISPFGGVLHAVVAKGPGRLPSTF